MQEEAGTCSSLLVSLLGPLLQRLYDLIDAGFERVQIMLSLHRILDMVEEFLRLSSVAVNGVLEEAEGASDGGVESKLIRPLPNEHCDDDDFAWFDKLQLDGGDEIEAADKSSPLQSENNCDTDKLPAQLRMKFREFVRAVSHESDEATCLVAMSLIQLGRHIGSDSLKTHIIPGLHIKHSEAFPGVVVSSPENYVINCLATFPSC
eukprot:766958-Hanusia_phi.AAC.2